ncbi:transglutaminase-like domain-containing protein [Arsenicicoccus sp. oral taxon 190]|uniref:transglutaminase-like domain-containing protein n=1 Tax=Arsenicicoccus sp. oral taxon 190 TaxID=1658671 RepID=UPI00067A3229|nr:transglutaminase-like domain-containing protein [Arsenicicoccus sp. oral taxon 190]AKT51633.1 hypothetical protein ADJ73_10615 [Arsenicicoccus sp. oral taxon 190]
MSQTRPAETALAAAAVVVATWPLTTLLREQSWVGPTILVVALIAVAGLALRALRTPAWLVVVLQLILLALVTCLLHGLGSGPLGLPGSDVLDRLVHGLQEAGRTIRSYAAPAPATPGLRLLVGLLAGLVAVVVDHLVVARRSATLAGFPLLVVYLVSVVNTPGSLPAQYFCALAVAWLLLLVEQHRSRLGRWSTLTPSPTRYTRADDPSRQVARFAAAGRLVAVGAVLVAVLGQLALPDVPTRFVTEGLGRQQSNAGPALTFTSDVDITRSLGSRDPRPVLTYRTTGDADPPPLGVAMAKQYVDGHWRMLPTSATTQGTAGGNRSMPLPDGVAPDLPHTVATATFSDNGSVRPPQLAAPAPVLRADIDAPWRRDVTTGLLAVGRSVSDYSVQYAVPTLTPERLTRSDGNQEPYASAAFNDADYLDVDPASQDLVRSRTQQILEESRQSYGPRTSAYHKAMVIQQHLRSPAYTYSLTLAPLTPEEEAQGVSSADAVSHFLLTRRGYCTQFSTAMVMMARSEGIPARVVFGFLPGTQQARGERIVRAADAHAWPELFISGVGWTRFEPTPGGRSGLPPAWAEPPAATPTPTASSAAAPSTAARPTPTATATTTAAAAPGVGDQLRSWFTPGRVATLAVLLALALLLSLLPLRAAAVRRGRLRRASGPAAAVEAHWTTLAEQLGDLGMPPPQGHTPRMLRDHYTAYPLLGDDGKRALVRVLSTVERARYAPPGASASPTQVEADARTARKAVARSRTWTERLRAALLPTAGRH